MTSTLVWAYTPIQNIARTHAKGITFALFITVVSSFLGIVHKDESRGSSEQNTQILLSTRTTA